MNNEANFQEFFKAYLICALWSSSDTIEEGEEPINLDNDYDIDDIDIKCKKELESEARPFYEANKQYFDYETKTCLDRFYKHGIAHEETNTYDKYAQAGHDFWLTRNGHGTGFWDKNELSKENRDILTEACKKYPEINLYIGDDNKIYC